MLYNLLVTNIKLVAATSISHCSNPSYPPFLLSNTQLTPRPPSSVLAVHLGGLKALTDFAPLVPPLSPLSWPDLPPGGPKTAWPPQ